MSETNQSGLDPGRRQGHDAHRPRRCGDIDHARDSGADALGQTLSPAELLDQIEALLPRA